ncbi:MAG: tetraacyldisaccharide 4'-kinase [Candidatus Binatia bacterium]
MAGLTVRGVWERRGFAGRLLGSLLWPASIGYSVVAQLRNGFFNRGWIKSVRLPRPVISIGNLTVGGTGKTPTCLWLAGELRRQGLKVAILSRGYRRKETQPVILQPCKPSGDMAQNEDELAQAGDEPLMMARLYDQTVGVGADRVRSAHELLRRDEKIDAFILDDGFQHRHVKRDVDLVLLGSDCSGVVLPAGPFREPRRNLQRGDFWLVTGAEAQWQRYLPPERSSAVFTGTLQPLDLISYDARRWKHYPLTVLHHSKILTIAGIANPDNFYQSIHEWEGQIVHTLEFPDHHVYSAKDWQEISRMARLVDLIVTTEKDILKLIGFPFARGKLLALRVGMEVAGSDRLVSALAARIRQAHCRES